MNDDWQAGDLAVCVDASDTNGGVDAIRALVEGRIYRVAEVTPPSLWVGMSVAPGLVIVGITRPWGHNDFHCGRFRKIRSDKHEDCEPEFVQLLKRSKVTA